MMPDLEDNFFAAKYRRGLVTKPTFTTFNPSACNFVEREFNKSCPESLPSLPMANSLTFS